MLFVGSVLVECLIFISGFSQHRRRRIACAAWQSFLPREGGSAVAVILSTAGMPFAVQISCQVL